jgi:SAM-dependent methyltransferase
MQRGFLARSADFLYGNIYGLQQRLFDVYMGTSTFGSEFTSSDFFTTGSDNMPYEGCMWPALEHALAELQPSTSDVFVDFGCGKGKSLLVAGRQPYGRVMGVELDAGLAERARQNVARGRRRLKADDVDVYAANVLEWGIPDDVSVVFMFNPFIQRTFRDAATSIFASYDRNPRRLHIIYQHPWEHDWLVATGRVVVENVRSTTWPSRRRWWESGDVITTYHVTGEDDDSSAATCLHRGRATGEAMKRWSVANGHKFGFNLQTLAATGMSPNHLAELELPTE